MNPLSLNTELVSLKWSCQSIFGCEHVTVDYELMFLNLGFYDCLCVRLNLFISKENVFKWGFKQEDIHTAYSKILTTKIETLKYFVLSSNNEPLCTRRE